MNQIWEGLAQTALAKWIAGSAWPYPMLETIHVIGLGLLFGPIILMDLRILGRGRTLPMRELGRFLLPCVWTGFTINAASGLLLFISNAPGFVDNTAFRIKIGLIALAGLNALLFHHRTYAKLAALPNDIAPPPSARLAAALSIGLWLATIAAGRLIAYLD